MESNQQIRVDRNVPIPIRREVVLRGLTYPFDSMAVGDSFFLPGSVDERRRLARAMQPMVTSCKKARRLPAKFKVATRQMSNGLRVWRIA